ncbi:flagellar hook-length control protein FliK [Pseudoruegeria sp. HB172150]|uniref:flagellar hook-length control protein FliK n=1 Tax=Pseudoruegeria sp. HB172150 TaxID=2721164 RepID=UPI001555D929|nr:flagellar hook-length control protein FliK [Pseudoruegeria sp. HB172150]
MQPTQIIDAQPTGTAPSTRTGATSAELDRKPESEAFHAVLGRTHGQAREGTRSNFDLDAAKRIPMPNGGSPFAVSASATTGTIFLTLDQSLDLRSIPDDSSGEFVETLWTDSSVGTDVERDSTSDDADSSEKADGSIISTEVEIIRGVTPAVPTGTTPTDPAGEPTSPDSAGLFPRVAPAEGAFPFTLPANPASVDATTIADPKNDQAARSLHASRAEFAVEQSAAGYARAVPDSEGKVAVSATTNMTGNSAPKTLPSQSDRIPPNKPAATIAAAPVTPDDTLPVQNAPASQVQDRETQSQARHFPAVSSPPGVAVPAATAHGSTTGESDRTRTLKAPSGPEGLAAPAISAAPPPAQGNAATLTAAPASSATLSKHSPIGPAALPLEDADTVRHTSEPVTGTGQNDSRISTTSGTRFGAETVIPRQLALQLTDAARQMPDRPVELTLEPAELGRVRMTLAAGDATMVVTLAIERGETADLLRRHIDTLAQEFRSIGYRDVSFEFSGGEKRDGREPADDHDAALATQSDAEDPAPDPLRIRLTDRVDIRI